MNIQRTSTSAFGLIAWLEQTQIHLPLKAIECRFEASDAAVDVQIDQIFHQSAGRPLDVTYSFPLPSKAFSKERQQTMQLVCELTEELGDRLIQILDKLEGVDLSFNVPSIQARTRPRAAQVDRTSAESGRALLSPHRSQRIESSQRRPRPASPLP